MALPFDVKVRKTGELSIRIQKYQGRVEADSKNIAAIEKQYEESLLNARATQKRHLAKLNLLNQEFKDLIAMAEVSGEVSGGASPDIIMSDGEDGEQSLPLCDGSPDATARSFHPRATKANHKVGAEIPTHIPSIHSDFPTVAMYNGNWHELTCIHCGTNTTAQLGGFLKGAGGFRKHHHKNHGPLDKDVDLQSFCALRLVSDVDAALLASGQLARDYPIEVHRSEGRIMTAQPRQGSEGGVLYPEYPTVVKLGGAVVELTCKTCGANARMLPTTEFFKGVAGFQQHLRLHQQSSTKTAISSFCNMRPVSERDQALLEAGSQPSDHPIRIIPTQPHAIPKQTDVFYSTPKPQLRRSTNFATNEHIVDTSAIVQHSSGVLAQSAPAKGSSNTVLGALVGYTSDSDSE